MKNFLILGIILTLISPVFALEIQQNFRGMGAWETSDLNFEYSGVGDVSFASHSTITDAGTISKQGLEFDGRNGKVKLKGSIGPKIGYNFNVKNANNISLRVNLDTATSEEVQDSTIGKLLLYNVGINGRINGSSAEMISNGHWMGRAIPISTLAGTGVFEINSTVMLKEYDGGLDSQLPPTTNI